MRSLLSQGCRASERITIGSRTGVVLNVEPLLGEHELRLVTQLTRDKFDH